MASLSSQANKFLTSNGHFAKKLLSLHMPFHIFMIIMLLVSAFSSLSSSKFFYKNTILCLSLKNETFIYRCVIILALTENRDDFVGLACTIAILLIMALTCCLVILANVFDWSEWFYMVYLLVHVNFQKISYFQKIFKFFQIPIFPNFIFFKFCINFKKLEKFTKIHS